MRPSAFNRAAGDNAARCRIFDPHTVALDDDGGVKQPDTRQIDCDRWAGPPRLTNPCTLRAGDERALGIAGGRL